MNRINRILKLFKKKLEKKASNFQRKKEKKKENFYYT
jgi:hypothetical protein